MTTCLRCRKKGPTKGRGLCAPCYNYLRKYEHDVFIEYPTVIMTREDVLTDYVLLAGEGYPLKVIAERLGMKYDSFCQVLHRAAKAGDTRSPYFRGSSSPS